jgi:hypothetical protein
MPAVRILKDLSSALVVMGTLGVDRTVSYTMIVQREHIIVTKTHRAMSFMIAHMMAPQLVLVTMGSLAMALTVLISMNVLNLHAMPTQHVTTQMGHSRALVTEGIQGMEQIVQISMNVWTTIELFVIQMQPAIT